MTATGVKGDCSLNTSQYFHTSRNKILDPLHDFLQGICSMLIKLVLNKLVLMQGKFTVQYFNAKITAFNYGYVEMAISKFHSSYASKESTYAKPKRNADVAFPFLVSEKVSADNKFDGLIVHLLRIMELVFAPKLTESLIPYLRALIKDFFMALKRLFPDVDPINKYHHMYHYPDSILWAGPIAHYNCIRFEGKYGELKLRAQNVHNFKNPPKTIIRVSQSIQSATWGASDVQLHRFNAVNSCKDKVKNTLSRDDLCDLGYVDTDEIFCYSSVRVNDTEYRRGLYVCLEAATTRNDNMPLFGRITEIVVLQ